MSAAKIQKAALACAGALSVTGLAGPAFAGVLAYLGVQTAKGLDFKENSAEASLVNEGIKAIAANANGILANWAPRLFAKLHSSNLDRRTLQRAIAEMLRLSLADVRDPFLNQQPQADRSQLLQWFNNWELALQTHPDIPLDDMQAKELLRGHQDAWPILQYTLEWLDQRARGTQAALYGPFISDLPAMLADAFQHIWPKVLSSDGNEAAWRQIELGAFRRIEDILLQGLQPNIARVIQGIEGHVTSESDRVIDALKGHIQPTVRRARLYGPGSPLLHPKKVFVGRDDLVLQTASLLDTEQIVNIHGPGGIGKTEICRAALLHYLRQHPESKLLFVDLRSVTKSADSLRAALAAELDGGAEPHLKSDADFSAAIAELAPLIIFFDNFDSVDADPAALTFLEELARAEQAPNILLSSRNQYLDYENLPAGRLSTLASILAFEKYWNARSACPKEEALQEFVEKFLDCHPLSIALVASQARYFPAPDPFRALVEAWRRQPFELARVPQRDDKEHSLWRSCHLSVGRLHDSAKSLWFSLALRSAGVSSFAWQRCHGGRELDLRILMDGNLVERDNTAKLTVLAPLREYAWVEGTPEAVDEIAHDLRAVALLACLGRLSTASVQLRRNLCDEWETIADFGRRLLAVGPESARIALLETNVYSADAYEFDPVRGFEVASVLDEFASIFCGPLNGNPGLAASAARSRARTGFKLGKLVEARQHGERALRLYRQAADPEGEATALDDLGELAFFQGKDSEAKEKWYAALQIARQRGNMVGQANVLRNLGELALRQKRPKEAESNWKQALALYQQFGYKLGEANVLFSLGDLARDLGKKEEARSHWSEALKLHQAIGSALGAAKARLSLGHADMLTKSDAGAAEEHLTEALLLFRRAGSIPGELESLWSLGAMCSLISRSGEAKTYWEEALAVAVAVGDKASEARVLFSLGTFESEHGVAEQGERLLRRALPLYHSLSNRDAEAGVLFSLGDAAFRTQKDQEAGELFQRALELYKTLRSRDGEAKVYFALGQLQLRLRQTAAATRSFTSALADHRSTGNKAGEADALLQLGQSLLMAGNIDKAQTQLARALPIYRSLGNKGGEANILLNLGQVRLRQKREKDAIDYWNRAAEIYKTIGDRSGASKAFALLGHSALLAGDLEKAGVSLGASLSTQSTSDLQTAAATHRYLAELAMRKGSGGEATKHWRQALDLYQRVNDKEGELLVVLILADLTAQAGQLDQARAHWKDGVRLQHALKNPLGEARLLYSLCCLELQELRDEEAVRLGESALALFRQCGNRAEEQDVQIILGGLAFRNGKHDVARTHWNAALAISIALESPDGEAIAQSNLADLDAREGNLEKALARADHALSLYEAAGASAIQAIVHAHMAVACWKAGNLPEMHQRRAAAERIAAASESPETIAYVKSRLAETVASPPDRKVT